MTGMVQKMIDLSTAHMPESEPDFSDLRTAEHEFGWIVFVDAEYEVKVPEWIHPIYTMAIEEGAILINFDCDSPKSERFPSYDW